MGRKVFVSYKYGDKNVCKLSGIDDTRVRDYVDVFQSLLEKADEINKGEEDGEDLSDFQDETIASKLRDKIYDSSITVVFVSENMKDSIPEKDQWIPWEISYSLKESTRNGRTSRSNAVLAVVIPDESGKYDYYIEDNVCPQCHCRNLKTEILFGILRDNMFNIKVPEFTNCDKHLPDKRPYKGQPCYIYSVKWSDFTSDVKKYLDIAAEIRDDIDSYSITKIVK